MSGTGIDGSQQQHALNARRRSAYNKDMCDEASRSEHARRNLTEALDQEGSSKKAGSTKDASALPAPGLRAPSNRRQSVRKVNSLKRHIFLTLEDPSYSELSRAVSLLMLLLILITTASFVLESELCMKSGCVNGVLPFDPWASIFYWVEWVGISIFSMDYIARVTTSGDDARERIRFAIKPVNVIDFAAVIPFWVAGLMQSPVFAAPEFDRDQGGGGAGFLRAARLIRVFRILKGGRYTLGLKMLGGTFTKSFLPMSILFVVSAVLTVIFASVIW